MTSFANYPPPADLLEMLTYGRPHGSQTERDFIQKFITPHIDYVDEFGNLWKEVGSSPTILFSSHTDTVHWVGGRQKIEYSEDGWIHTDLESKECLGADCTAGVWIMLEMIKADVPGIYVFHRAEEVGGQGSSFIAESTPYLLDGIQVAIAFDRKGFDSIITHQFGQRCCSDKFAKSLNQVLGGTFRLDDGGSFTDTANYTDLVAECTNLSVGYQNAHTSNECLHIPYLTILRDILVGARWDDLVIKRTPGEYESLWAQGRPYSGVVQFKSKPKHSSSPARGAWHLDDFWDADKPWEEDLMHLIKTKPEAVARFLVEMGYDADDITANEMENELPF